MRAPTTRVMRVYRGYGWTELRLSDGRKIRVYTTSARGVTDTVLCLWHPGLGPYGRYPFVETVSAAQRQSIQHAMARHPKCR